jgi:hypothetical protein
MMMRGFLRAGVLTAALCAASPALASDFSGIGRVFWWGIAAIGVLIALAVTLIRRKGRAGSPETNLLLSVAAAVTLAPGVLIHVDDQWIPMPFPGLAVALLDGSLGLLFPVPVASMVLCWLGLSRLLARGKRDSEEGAEP